MKTKKRKQWCWFGDYPLKAGNMWSAILRDCGFAIKRTGDTIYIKL